MRNVTEKLSIDSEETDAAFLVAHDNVALTIQCHQLGTVVTQ